MSLAARQARVAAAQLVLRQRRADASRQWARLATDWRAGWTPGRILIAGAALGFLSGRVKGLPSRAAGSMRAALPLLRSAGALWLEIQAQVAALAAVRAASSAADAADAAADVVADGGEDAFAAGLSAGARAAGAGKVPSR